MKHMQTLAIIMMTVAMVFAAPHSPSYRAKRTPGNCSDTNLQKKEIHAEAASLLEKLKVRKQVVVCGGDCQFVAYLWH